MSNIFRAHSGKIIAAGLVAAGAFLLPSSILPNPFRTPGVKNIENRYSAGGGSKTHTPGAGTKRGHEDDVVPLNNGKGPGTDKWEEKYGEQRAPPGPFDKSWNKSHYGGEKSS